MQRQYHNVLLNLSRGQTISQAHPFMHRQAVSGCPHGGQVGMNQQMRWRPPLMPRV